MSREKGWGYGGQESRVEGEGERSVDLVKDTSETVPALEMKGLGVREQKV